MKELSQMVNHTIEQEKPNAKAYLSLAVLIVLFAISIALAWGTPALDIR